MPPKPDSIRTMPQQWAWVDHRFRWFWDDLSQAEILLYFFLVVTSDPQGCSWWSTRKTCKVLKIGPASLIRARQTLEQRMLIATTKDEFNQRIIYQVLPLPIEENVRIEIPLKPPLKEQAPKSQAGQTESTLSLSDEQISFNVKHLQALRDLLK